MNERVQVLQVGKVASSLQVCKQFASLQAVGKFASFAGSQFLSDAQTSFAIHDHLPLTIYTVAL